VIDGGAFNKKRSSFPFFPPEPRRTFPILRRRYFTFLVTQSFRDVEIRDFRVQRAMFISNTSREPRENISDSLRRDGNFERSFIACE